MYFEATESGYRAVTTEGVYRLAPAGGRLYMLFFDCNGQTLRPVYGPIKLAEASRLAGEHAKRFSRLAA